MTTSAATFGLTPRQRDAYQFIARYIDAHDGVGPSLDDISAALGNQSRSTAHRLVTSLMQRGLIQRFGRTARSIAIVARPAVTLPSHIHARLERFCVDQKERFDAVLADAVALHLDELESINLQEHA